MIDGVFIAASQGINSDKNLHGFGTDAAADAKSIRLATDASIGGRVVDLCDVARVSVEEDDDSVFAKSAVDDLFESPGPVGGYAGRAGGGVAGEVYDAADEFAFVVPCSDDADLGINGPGFFYHVGISVAWMCECKAVFHAPATVERDISFFTATESEGEFGAGFPGFDDGFCDSGNHAFEVDGIGHGGLFVGEVLHKFAGMVDLAGEDHSGGAGGVGVRGTDEDGFGEKVGFSGDSFSNFCDLLLHDDEGVEADHGDSFLSIIEDNSASFAGVVKLLVECLPVSTGSLHADVGRNVDVGESCFDGCGCGRQGDHEKREDRDEPFHKRRVVRVMRGRRVIRGTETSNWLAEIGLPSVSKMRGNEGIFDFIISRTRGCTIVNCIRNYAVCL